MADRFFSNWESLINAVDAKAINILKKDVAPVAENILKKHIKSDIYDVYTPKTNGWVDGTTYHRRYALEQGITTIVQKDKHTILITSNATASPAVLKGWSFRNRYPGSFLKLLESGNMGIWRGGFPRPAVTNTQAEIDSSKKIENAIKNGIKREIGSCI